MKNMSSNASGFFLDFDGVIVESANIKTQAFYDLYLPFGDKIAAFAREYHLKHQGVSRYKKFSAIHEERLKRSCLTDEMLALSQKFSQIVFEKILRAPLVKGVLNFLEKNNEARVPLFLLSATPHEELLEICKEKNVYGFFKEIYGSPFEKSEQVEYIIQNNELKREALVFVGDSIADLNAALKTSIYFIGRVPEGEDNPFDSSVTIISDFNALLL